MKLDVAIHAFTSGGQSDGSSLTHPPHMITDTPAVRDIARHRLVKTNPDVDAEGQTDEAAFVGKKYRTQDTKYGHLINEYDSSDEAKTSALARPYTRVLRHDEPNQLQENRDRSFKKSQKFNPDEV